MDGTRRGIRTLVQSAITGEALPLPEGFDLEQAMPLIQRHQIVTLAFDGAVRCGISKNLPVMRQLFQKYCQVLLHSEQQMQAIQGLYQAFDENGIDYLPLKGCNMKRLYPKPELRPMGDADILIRTAQYDRIRPVVQALGFTEQQESDHELIWHSSALHLELHKRLIPSYNKDYYAYFGDGWRLAKAAAGTRYEMSPEDTFVYLFTHFAKHYRDGGIGIRHVVDLWVYRRSVPKLDEEYVRAELQKLQLLAFYENILRLIGVWFEGQEADEIAAFLSDFILDSGSWGSKENHILSTGVKNARTAGSVAGGRLKRIKDGFFPNRLVMEQKYPVLKKCPALLPVFWPVRWGSAVLFRRDNLRRQHQELKLTKAENITTYQQALNYVGLDFHFKE